MYAIRSYYAFLPVGGADIAVLLVELEGLDHAQGLVDIPPQGEIIDHRMTDDSITVNEEGAAKSDAGIKQA